jgi:molybdopterin-dependent oxidoreductase alpha subunit
MVDDDAPPPPPTNSLVETATSVLAPTNNKPAYAGPAAGPRAVASSFAYAARTSGLVRGLRVFLDVNQQEGFDCPGCAWPDPKGHRATFEFCENGARAVAHEADRRLADAAFFARHSIEALRAQSDHWLEQQGRLAQPMVLLPGAERYTPIGWDEAAALVAKELKALGSPDEAVFYTSGRASNEAAFLFQLFVRAFGTNNLPDCSNMCHESSGKGLLTTIGVGKGTVQLEDFAGADCILVIGQNPGTNHPRMLSTLVEARKRGATVVSVNPLRERALERFAHPQHAKGMLGIGDAVCSHFVQVKLGGDIAFLKGVQKALFILDRQDRERGGVGVLDRDFLDEHCVVRADRGEDGQGKDSSLEAFIEAVAAHTWEELEEQSGVGREQMGEIAGIMAESGHVIACWAMGITQHEHGTDNVREIVNLLLLGGHVGRPGAGVCPVRGHSNVQGDRTMGIIETPDEKFLRALDHACGIKSPREHGLDVVHAIEALEQGRVGVFVALGGNFVAATPDTPRVVAGLSQTRLTVQIATKLNRSHLHGGQTALILPCLGRTEVDATAAGPQVVTIEDSMGIVHQSEGHLQPASGQLRSEVAIIAALAKATVGDLPGAPGGEAPVVWKDLATDHGLIRALIARVVPGFQGFPERLAASPGGFQLDNPARRREWRTASGKAELTVLPMPRRTLKDGQLLLQTFRSHDQFNTTIYDLNDRYRGVRGKRRVLFVHADDLRTRGLTAGDQVAITSHHDGKKRRLVGFEVIPYDLPRGCVAGYFPELNPLVPLEQRARESHTPASKSVVVTIAKEAP